MPKSGIYQPIDTLPGVQPETDKTAVSTGHFTYSDKIRWENDVPKKIKGWQSILFDYSSTILGTVRSIFTDFINGKFYTVLGSNKKLYSVIGSRLTNITPLLVTSEAVPDSLDTHYDTLTNNPFSSTNGSMIITVTDADAANYEVGDTVYFSGAAGFAGILAAAINGDSIIRTIGAGFYTVNFGVAANATTTGGGAAVVRSSGLITVNDLAHGQLDGDRVGIDDAATTAGILDTEINNQFIIRNVTTNSFDVMTVGEATSSVSAGGGVSTIYFQEIPEGNLNETAVQGYGAGFYGMGLYGTALLSTSARSFPRIWFFDRYANSVVMTPGNQTGVYQWFGNNETAPQLVANAPTKVNYVFVQDNILVTLGAEDGGNPQENRIFASDQNDITMWTSSANNQVYDDNVEGAGRLISHCPVEDYSLLFTENKTYSFRYIGLPFVWETKTIDDTIGIIAPLARCNAKGDAYWMGLDNFYRYRGGKVEIVPANSQDEATLLRYVFDNLNIGQKSKFFAWYNKEFDEVWFHYATADSNEPNRVATVNLKTGVWAPHTLDRTAAESAGVKLKNPRLANANILYQHEYGFDADGASMPWSLVGNKRYYETDSTNLNSIVPDSVQTGNITFTYLGYLFPQSPLPVDSPTPYTVTPTTEFIPFTASGRFHQYALEGNELGQEWIGGAWMEELQSGPRE